MHKYFDIENFPYDFESDKKVESKKVTVDGKIGKNLNKLHYLFGIRTA